MKIAIVDDDTKMQTILRGYLEQLVSGHVQIDCFASGEAFLQVWQPGTFDLVILDIFMDGRTGMDVAREVRAGDREVKLVFCTTSNEFASESYEVDACYYLHKPFGPDRVQAMLDRLDLAEMERLRTVILPDGATVALRSILYADYAAHCVTLHRQGGQCTVCRASFAQVEALLCAYPYFFSPSKGIVVNFYEVAAQKGDTFQMSDGSVLPISRRRAREVLDAYSSFLFQRLRKGGDV